jgi:hypothetical protein
MRKLLPRYLARKGNLFIGGFGRRFSKTAAAGFRANADDPIDQKLLRLEDQRSPSARVTRAWALFDVNDTNRQTATPQSQVKGAFGCELRQNVRIILG